MVATNGPKAKALGAALRRARERNTKLTVRGVARQLNVSHSVVSYWETGQRLPKLEDLGGYLAAISVTGEERDRILDLTRGAAEPNWLAAGIPGVSQGLIGALECERTAVAITEWSPLVVSGLLQTSDYARAIFGSGAASRGEVDARVLLRAGRRDMFTRSTPVTLRALVGEPALRAPIGGRAVHLSQLRYLVKVAEEFDSVTVQVIRGSTPWHPGMAGPFVVYEFEDSPAIVHIEHHRSSAFLYEESDVVEYQRVGEALASEVAMSPTDSQRFIADLINQLETAE